MKIKIKKGEKYLCLQDWVMDTDEIAYKKGNVYISEIDGCITDIGLDTRHTMDLDDEFYEHFELVQENSHYDNKNGSIYKFCEDQKLNSWEFDLIKRIVRCRKKGQFIDDLEKTKKLIDLYLFEFSK